MVHQSSKSKDKKGKGKGKKSMDSNIKAPTPSSLNWKPGMLGYLYPLPNLALDKEDGKEFE